MVEVIFDENGEISNINDVVDGLLSEGIRREILDSEGQKGTLELTVDDDGYHFFSNEKLLVSYNNRNRKLEYLALLFEFGYVTHNEFLELHAKIDDSGNGDYPEKDGYAEIFTHLHKDLPSHFKINSRTGKRNITSTKGRYLSVEGYDSFRTSFVYRRREKSNVMKYKDKESGKSWVLNSFTGLVRLPNGQTRIMRDFQQFRILKYLVEIGIRGEAVTNLDKLKAIAGGNASDESLRVVIFELNKNLGCRYINHDDRVGPNSLKTYRLHFNPQYS